MSIVWEGKPYPYKQIYEKYREIRLLAFSMDKTHEKYPSEFPLKPSVVDDKAVDFHIHFIEKKKEEFSEKIKDKYGLNERQFRQLKRDLSGDSLKETEEHLAYFTPEGIRQTLKNWHNQNNKKM